MIHLDACVLLKFIKSEPEPETLRAWRHAFPEGTELVTSELAQLEITRTLLRAGIDHQRVPYVTGQALWGVYLIDPADQGGCRPAPEILRPHFGSRSAISSTWRNPIAPLGGRRDGAHLTVLPDRLVVR